MGSGVFEEVSGFFFEFFDEFDVEFELIALVAAPAQAVVEVVPVQIVVFARVEYVCLGGLHSLGERLGEQVVRHGYGLVFRVAVSWRTC